METGEKWDDPSPSSLSLPRSLSPGFRPQATAHVLLQILVKKLKWIHEWSDGTHGVSAVAKCATIRIAASSPLVRASVVRLTTTRHHRGRGRIFLRFSTDDWSRLFAYPSTFLSFFFSISPFIPSFRLLSFEMEELFFRRRKTGDGSFDG